ncbi:hypothetical protein Bbelb_143690 [Branchiostoma belcheri]|nr:hypothetical protein Bbelb_143690 [Branchiostoma belcheri]
MKKGSIFKFFSRAQPASEAGAAGGGGPDAGAAGGGGSGDATGSTVSEDPAADVDDAPPEEGEGSAKKQKLTGRSISGSTRLPFLPFLTHDFFPYLKSNQIVGETVGHCWQKTHTAEFSHSATCGHAASGPQPNIDSPTLAELLPTMVRSTRKSGARLAGVQPGRLLFGCASQMFKKHSGVDAREVQPCLAGGQLVFGSMSGFSFLWTVGVLFFEGFLNGTLVVAKTYLYELPGRFKLTRRQNSLGPLNTSTASPVSLAPKSQSLKGSEGWGRAYVHWKTVPGSGSACPVLGGFLACPATRFQTFDKPFFKQFPYILPCAVVACLEFCILIAMEPGPYRKVRPGQEPVIERYRGPGGCIYLGESLNKNPKYDYISLKQISTQDVAENDKENSNRQEESTISLLRDRLVLISCALYALYALASISSSQRLVGATVSASHYSRRRGNDTAVHRRQHNNPPPSNTNQRARPCSVPLPVLWGPVGPVKFGGQLDTRARGLLLLAGRLAEPATPADDPVNSLRHVLNIRAGSVEDGAWLELLPLLLVSDPQHGGYNCNAAEIAIVLTTLAIYSGITQATLNPYIASKFTYKSVYVTGVMLHAVGIILLPSMVNITGAMSSQQVANQTETSSDLTLNFTADSEHALISPPARESHVQPTLLQHISASSQFVVATAEVNATAARSLIGQCRLDGDSRKGASKRPASELQASVWGPLLLVILLMEQGSHQSVLVAIVMVGNAGVVSNVPPTIIFPSPSD